MRNCDEDVAVVGHIAVRQPALSSERFEALYRRLR
jgi:hypothetical protein